MSDAKPPRLYLAAALAVGATLALAPGQAHYLRHVLRLREGAAVAVFNAEQGEFLAAIAAAGKRETRLVVERQLRSPAPEPGPWLVFAPIKRARIDWLVEKATELGASALLPVWTARTQIERLNLDRSSAHAVEAAEQCGRLSVPEIRPPERLDGLLARWPAERRLIVCDETGRRPAGGARPIAEALAAIGPRPLALLVGPEGGWDPGELDRLDGVAVATRVALGPRVLRAETAALAALAVAQAVLGER